MWEQKLSWDYYNHQLAISMPYRMAMFSNMPTASPSKTHQIMLSLNTIKHCTANNQAFKTALEAQGFHVICSTLGTLTTDNFHLLSAWTSWPSAQGWWTSSTFTQQQRNFGWNSIKSICKSTSKKILIGNFCIDFNYMLSIFKTAK